MWRPLATRRLSGAIGDPPHHLVALVGNQEQDELAQQIAPAMGQPSADAVDEAGHGRIAGL